MTHICFAYLLKEQSFGQFGGYLGRREDPCPVDQSAFHSTSLIQTMCLLMTLFSVCSGSNFFHLLVRLLLLNYLHIHSSLAAQGIQRGTGGSRRWWFCFSHHTDQRWDQKVPSWSRSSVQFPSRGSCQLLLCPQRQKDVILSNSFLKVMCHFLVEQQLSVPLTRE